MMLEIDIDLLPFENPPASKKFHPDESLALGALLPYSGYTVNIETLLK